MDYQGKICCVTGHREIPADKLDNVRRELQREVDTALNDGYRVFITGFAEGVDMLFARCVNERRGEYPDIFLEAALPYANRSKRLDKDGKELLSTCNGVKIICQEYQHDCFFQRNRYMVQQSSRVIAVYDGRSEGGTLFTMDYAEALKRDLRVIEISK
jgi:uncharacterized phage-like protein YoqJ